MTVKCCCIPSVLSECLAEVTCLKEELMDDKPTVRDFA